MDKNEIRKPIIKRRAQSEKLATKLKSLKNEIHDLQQKINDYKAFSPEIEQQNIVNLRDEIDSISEKVVIQKEAKSGLIIKLHEVNSEKINPLMFWKSFTQEQRVLRKNAKNLAKEISEIDAKLGQYDSIIFNNHQKIEDGEKRLLHHANFDLAEKQKAVTGYEKQIKDTQHSYDKAIDDLKNAENFLLPHIEEYERLSEQIISLENEIELAEKFNSRLNAAPDAKARRSIHLECESRFGEGSPRQVINENKRKITPLKRNLPKLKRRVEEESQKLDRKISYLLIDGNNLCYEDEDFIGLRGIKSVLPALEKNIKVTIVFDASIRSLLKTGNQGVKKEIGDLAKVHVAPTKSAADEYLMKMAGTDPETYVLSNDRFKEYHDYSVVRSKRMIRFLIAEGKFMAHDLDISVQI